MFFYLRAFVCVYVCVRMCLCQHLLRKKRPMRPTGKSRPALPLRPLPTAVLLPRPPLPDSRLPPVFAPEAFATHKRYDEVG